MLARTPATLVEVACAGCGRIQRVPASKLIDCDGYICSYTGCATNPEFRPPEPPAGGVCTFALYAAGTFSGWTVRRATPAEQRSIRRAQEVRAQGLRLLKQRQHATGADR